MGTASSQWLAQLDLSKPVDAATTELIFNEYDKDHNGYLDGWEAKQFVEEWCKHYGVKDPCQAIQSFFDTFDADKDGKITKAELIGAPPTTTRERSKPVTGQAPATPTAAARGHARVPSSPFVVPPKDTIDIRELETKFRRCAVTKDRHFHLKKYPDCFVGSETVELLLAHGFSKTRSEALYYGNLLMDNGVFLHVTRDHLFKDEALFYQFTNRQAAPGPTMAEVRAAEAVHQRYLANKDDDDDVIIVEL